MQLEDDSLWQSFPHALETLEGARRYISAFQALLQELSTLNPQQVHALWVCSLLAIPLPTERMPPLGGFPKDLSELNLSGPRRGGRPAGGTTQSGPRYGPPSGGPTPATGSDQWSGLLMLSRLPVQVHRSLPAGSP